MTVYFAWVDKGRNVLGLGTGPVIPTHKTPMTEEIVEIKDRSSFSRAKSALLHAHIFKTGKKVSIDDYTPKVSAK